MARMANWLLTVAPVLPALICFLLLLIYIQEEATFFGLDIFYGDMKGTSAKYTLSVYPHPELSILFRSLIIIWNLAGMVYVTYRKGSGKELPLRKRFFIAWSGAWSITTIWIFVFDREIHKPATTACTLVAICSFMTLVCSCQSMKLHDVQKSRFRYFVVEPVGLLFVWSCLAAVMSFGYTLAYKPSLHLDVARHSELVTPYEASGIAVGILSFLYAIFWIFDIAYWGESADCVFLVYPTCCIISASMFWNNYDSDKEMSLNNLLCMGLFVVCTVGCLARTRAKHYFLTRNGQRDHED